MANRSLPVTAIPLLLLAGAAALFFLNQDAADSPTASEAGNHYKGEPTKQSQPTGSDGSSISDSKAAPESASDSDPGSAKIGSGTKAGTSTATAPGASGWIPLDLENAPSLDRLPGWEVRRGNFQLVRIPDNHPDNSSPRLRPVLELLPEPIVEGKIRCARMMWGGGGIRARMQGEKSRRAHPRFSVGLHQDRELHLRAFPGEHRLELVACDPDLLNESLLAKTDVPDWNYTSGDWIWLELQILTGTKTPGPAPTPGLPPTPASAPAPPADAAGAVTPPSICEGRVWKDGEPRPPQPQLIHPLNLPPAVFFAAIQGAPFALKPIRIDAAEILTLSPLPSAPLPSAPPPGSPAK